MRVYAAIVTALVVAGCAPKVPNSATGVGFDAAPDYQAQREAQLAGTGTLELGVQISDEVVVAGVDETTTVAPSTTATATTPVALVQVNNNNPAISDSQNFEAVSARETIESAAEKRAAQQSVYQVIAPTALPTRSGGSSASVVQFALSTTNLVGQAVYTRSALSGTNRYQRNCAKYPSPDLAQQAFLAAGGPDRDRKGIDPDGDGFACFWDPTPFRQGVQN